MLGARRAEREKHERAGHDGEHARPTPPPPDAGRRHGRARTSAPARRGSGDRPGYLAICGSARSGRGVDVDRIAWTPERERRRHIRGAVLRHDLGRTVRGVGTRRPAERTAADRAALARRDRRARLRAGLPPHARVPRRVCGGRVGYARRSRGRRMMVARGALACGWDREPAATELAHEGCGGHECAGHERVRHACTREIGQRRGRRARTRRRTRERIASRRRADRTRHDSLRARRPPSRRRVREEARG